ncbi:MAG: SRPBCC family protein [Actinomycetota bacterium]
MHFENTLTIRRSPHEVFEYLAAFENVPRWNYAIVETHKTSQGPVGVGTTYRQTRSIPSPAEETFTVTVFEPEHRLAIHGDLVPFQGTLSYELEPVSDEHCSRIAPISRERVWQRSRHHCLVVESAKR